MYKLGLTGSIATGKSTVLAQFSALGHETLSADAAVHELYESPASAPIAAAFPQAVKNNRIDRRALSALLISSPLRMQELNDIVHPLVHTIILDFMERATKKGAGLIIVDIPLLFESNHTYGFDGVALTWCSPEVQKQRALARPDMNVEKFNFILAHQMSQSEKKQRADFLINTNGTLEETQEQVARIADLCLARSKKPN